MASKKVKKTKYVLKGFLEVGLDKDGNPVKIYKPGDSIECTKEFADQLKKENKI
ncbi:hypothetical protein [Spongiimicrobium salis]|uniref:hypothetical protein n=1 Tax=Spongiimicrobium salis TaxID=1667022 RepID=UPI00374DAE1B